ncbi:hypothetical protein I601_1945 [Nocardioides dokdonensis FR1436]|uniref:Phosphatidate phosphatase APP1 catalytic domain-containing protein n=2 Tax=Nocardioides TaxID=1839 RepID=A0A1A9GJD9_9ACTN|nr:hypothetical protein I601_1945 [Nocardioides dokdonensis FR1436]
MHPAVLVEDAVHGLIDRGLRRAGWVPRVVPHVGYGLEGEWVRVLARVVLVPEGSLASRHPDDARGWRRFVTQSASGIPVQVEVGGTVTSVETDREGYVDVRLPADLPAGWGRARLLLDDSPPTSAHLSIAAADARHGLVSDVDDTVMVTMLPRPLVAFRNAFVSREVDRVPVPGMAALYRDLLAAHPDTFVVYLSTGAWNVASAIGRFLQRHGYPPGPALLTDWGPAPTGWFRSGQQHKITELRRLLVDFPQLSWILVGDDGQHDPSTYAQIAREHPGRVDAVLIRQLSLPEQVVRHGRLDGEADEADDEPADLGRAAHPEHEPGHEAGARRTGRGADGAALTLEARRLGLLD